MESRNSKPMNALSEILAVTTSLTDPSKNESLDPKVFDKDRQQWLREAFENNLEDIPKKILNYLKELTEINDKKKFDEKDRIKFIFEDLREMCYNFDSARDFYKMGGFQKLDPYIFSSIIDFRIYSIDCLSTILQNNIELQTAYLDDKLICYLDMINSYLSEERLCKSILSLLSALVTNFLLAAKNLVDHLNKSRVHLKILDASSQNCHLRLFRLFNNLLITSPDLLISLLDLNLLQKMCSLQYTEDMAESCVNILLTIDKRTILNLIVHSESNKMLRNFIEKLLEFLNDENFRKNLIDFQQKHFKY